MSREIRLYHLSPKKGLSKLIPKVPSCAISYYEDTTVKRVCFSDYIEGCLSALQNMPMKYYVYVPKGKIKRSQLHKPTVNEVRDARYTHEVWVLEEIEVECIGVIESSNWDWSERHTTKRGVTTFFHYPYEWKEIYREDLKEKLILGN